MEYVYLNGSLLATRNAGTIKFQHTDALGSPIAVTDAAGQVVERTDYQPYGSPIGKTVDGIGYTGHAMDGATGLTYMQQRYYDQDLGRFLSVDPVAADSVLAANFNRYWYANNNPYKFT
ncbi:RHS repeat-associated core domain-containing protein, partial [Xanthomonas perforans]